MEHYLVCSVNTDKFSQGRETAQLEGFVQSCDLKTAKQYFDRKRRKGHNVNPTNVRLFQLVEVK